MEAKDIDKYIFGKVPKILINFCSQCFFLIYSKSERQGAKAFDTKIVFFVLFLTIILFSKMLNKDRHFSTFICITSWSDLSSVYLLTFTVSKNICKNCYFAIFYRYFSNLLLLHSKKLITFVQCRWKRSYNKITTAKIYVVLQLMSSLILQKTLLNRSNLTNKTLKLYKNLSLFFLVYNNENDNNN